MKRQIPPIKIIGIPITDPIPVIVNIVPTIIFTNPTALRVDFQNSGAIRITKIIKSVGSINLL
jgi:hypothetical protein